MEFTMKGPFKVQGIYNERKAFNFKGQQSKKKKKSIQVLKRKLLDYQIVILECIYFFPRHF